MKTLVLLLCLLPTVAFAQNNLEEPPTPPTVSPPVYPYCGGGHDEEVLSYFQNSKVQITLHQFGITASVSSPSCGNFDGQSVDYIVILEGTATSPNYSVTNGKLKSVFTKDANGWFTVYWPAVNGVASNVLLTGTHFNIASPFTATWDGSSWSASVTGTCVENACPFRTAGQMGGEFCFSAP